MSKHIIDSHVHIFPEKIAEKAAEGIGSFYGLHMEYDGRVSTLYNVGKECKVDGYIVQSVATTVHQVKSINDFIAEEVSQHSESMFGFATLHPDMEQPEKEVDRVIEMGFKGIKLHPDFQQFAIDSDKACRLYNAVGGRLPILIHTGDSRYNYSNPVLMARAADKFPDTSFIAAHFGGWSEWESAEKFLCDKPNVWVDSSSSFYSMSSEEATHLIKRFGIERVFFGTDYPMWKITDELEFIDKLDLSDEDKEKLLWKNISDFLKLGYE